MTHISVSSGPRKQRGCKTTPGKAGPVLEADCRLWPGTCCSAQHDGGRRAYLSHHQSVPWFQLSSVVKSVVHFSLVFSTLDDIHRKCSACEKRSAVVCVRVARVPPKLLELPMLYFRMSQLKRSSLPVFRAPTSTDERSARHADSWTSRPVAWSGRGWLGRRFSAR